MTIPLRRLMTPVPVRAAAGSGSQAASAGRAKTSPVRVSLRCWASWCSPAWLGARSTITCGKAKPLTEKDTIVLADFANSTGDPVFDDTLNTALSISLRQSPFLNVLSENQVAKTLQMMTRPAGTRLTPEVARELCQRTGSKAYLAGSIASLGSEYVLGLKAVSCRNGDTLAQKQVTAAPRRRCWTRWARRRPGCAANWANRWRRCRSSMCRWPRPLRLRFQLCKRTA